MGSWGQCTTYVAGPGALTLSCFLGVVLSCPIAAGPWPLGSMPPSGTLQDIPTVSLAGTSSVPLTSVAPAAVTATASSPSLVTGLTTSRAIPSMFPGPSTPNASLLCNLLPSMGQSEVHSLAAGIYVGEGLLPVPAKLAEKIAKWEFVDMAELLPEFWSLSPKDLVTNTPPRHNPRRKRAITDIATWIQCFATYVSVMSTPHPQSVPELLAYLIFILRASQDFGGLAWVTYDAAFRRQAFITGNRQWSKVNPSLYSICFSGVARTGVRCELCLSLSHPTRECTLVCDPDPDISTRLKTLESAVLAFSANAPQQPGPSPRATRSSDTCRNWNIGRCRMLSCRYKHACRVCGGPNPAFACCDRPLGPRTHPNTQPLGPPPANDPRDGLGPFNRRFGPGPADRGARARPGSTPY
jgi:hypothetical protein